MQTLNREEFKSWLESIEPDAVVGFTGMAYACPIANFIGNSACVGAFAYESSLGSAELPKWAQYFISAVDRRTKRHAELTAEKALGILNTIEEL